MWIPLHLFLVQMVFPELLHVAIRNNVCNCMFSVDLVSKWKIHQIKWQIKGYANSQSTANSYARFSSFCSHSVGFFSIIVVSLGSLASTISHSFWVWCYFKHLHLHFEDKLVHRHQQMKNESNKKEW